jgi:hypothetical protein
MPPINPSGKKPGELVAIFSTVAMLHPNLSARAAKCIALGAQIESLYGAILTTVLGAHAAPAAAMYRSLNSLNAQSRVALAAAEVVLEEDDMDILNAITAICNRALKHRHRLAHWVWGRSPAYENAIVLINPEALLEYETGAQGFMHPNEGRGLLEDFDISRCLVYNEKALDEAVKELTEAEDLLAHFRFAVIPYWKQRLKHPDWIGLHVLKRHLSVVAELESLARRRDKNPSKSVRQRGRGRRSKPSDAGV